MFPGRMLPETPNESWASPGVRPCQHTGARDRCDDNNDVVMTVVAVVRWSSHRMPVVPWSSHARRSLVYMPRTAVLPHANLRDVGLLKRPPFVVLCVPPGAERPEGAGHTHVTRLLAHRLA
jgi:hypothetical protein